MARAVVGGGCFWCVEGAYKEMKGIDSALPAYAGGHDPNPNYNSVCSGVTGHAEVVEIIFDESIISYEAILEVFFTVHDPTQLNRQGNDIGTQYRSVIYYIGDEQKLIADNHHNYFQLNPGNGYCQMVVAPKLAKVRSKLSHLY